MLGATKGAGFEMLPPPENRTEAEVTAGAENAGGANTGDEVNNGSEGTRVDAGSTGPAEAVETGWKAPRNGAEAGKT